MIWTVVVLTCLAGELVFGSDYVYVNRYRPEFTSEKYFAKIAENIIVGSAVTRVEAKDGDVGSSVVYSIERGNEDDAFEIDSKNGIIKTKKKFEHEGKSNYNLRINANDGFYNAKTYVEIKITNVGDEKALFKGSNELEDKFHI